MKIFYFFFDLFESDTSDRTEIYLHANVIRKNPIRYKISEH